MPKGYFCAEIHVVDQESYEGYRQRVGATIEAFGGRLLVRGGDPRVLEGSEPTGRAAVSKFDSPERAMAWYNSPEYQAVLPMRLNNTTGRALLATGL